MTIREILQEIVLGDGYMDAMAGVNFIATVEDVDVSKYTCSVKLLGSDGLLEGVRLKAESGKDYGVVSIPEKGSFVVVSILGSEAGAFVSLCSKIQKMEFKDVNGFECVIEGGIVSVKNKGYSLRQAFDDILAAIGRLTVTTGVGPSGTPINIAEFQTVKQRLENFLK